MVHTRSKNYGDSSSRAAPQAVRELSEAAECIESSSLTSPLAAQQTLITIPVLQTSLKQAADVSKKIVKLRIRRQATQSSSLRIATYAKLSKPTSSIHEKASIEIDDELTTESKQVKKQQIVKRKQHNDASTMRKRIKTVVFDKYVASEKVVQLKEKQGSGFEPKHYELSKVSQFSFRRSTRLQGRNATDFSLLEHEEAVDETTNAADTTLGKPSRTRVRRRTWNIKLKKMKTKFLISLYVPEVYGLRRQRPIVRTNDAGFTFGHIRYPDFPRPTCEEVDAVVRILERETRQYLKTGVFVEPAHAAKEMTVDSIVRVIMSQATSNEGASDTHQHLIRAYPYHVDGEVYYGDIPNYHDMRVQSYSKLQRVIKRAGFLEMRSVAIKLLLDQIYATNVKHLKDGEVAFDGNKPGAKGFVPGLLSCSYFLNIYHERGIQGFFDFLVSFKLVGVKTAACIMSFNMNLPVFAVDTHVAAMSKLLGWIPPEGCNSEELMFVHLDARIPNGLKLALHQCFWQHRRNCARCSNRVKWSDQEWVYAHCSLEHLVLRNEEKLAIAQEGFKERNIPLQVRAAKARARTAARRGVLCVPKPDGNTELRIENDRVRKGKHGSSAGSGDADEKKVADGLTKVIYKLDDNFDAEGAYVIERTTWVPDYSKMEFTPHKLDTVAEEDDSQFEQLIVRKMEWLTPEEQALKIMEKLAKPDA